MINKYLKKLPEYDIINKSYSLNIDVYKLFNACLYSQEYNYPNKSIEEKLKTSYNQVKETIEEKMYFIYGK